ncbi:MAG TPA: CHAT domain-containing protein [Ktedonobacteraceae bacterium]
MADPSHGLSRKEIDRLVNFYIGVSGGYLGDFTYQTHAEFYPTYCGLDINPYEYEGTTRDRFITILSSLKPRDQARVLQGVIDRFPLGWKAPATRTEEERNKLLRIIQRLESGTSIPSREREAMLTVKVLLLAANPSSTDRLAIDEEMRAIEQKVRAAEHRDALVFQSNWAVRPDDLLQLLNQHRPQIVHFSGHGSHAGLSLAGNDGQVRLVTTQALTALFATLKDNIRLVFLNACYSREQALALVTNIDCVVGMKESIRDDAATVFASSFYRAIGFGRSIQEAFDQGKTALLLEGIPEEDIPELLVKDGIDPSQVVLIGLAGNPS